MTPAALFSCPTSLLSLPTHLAELAPIGIEWQRDALALVALAAVLVSIWANLRRKPPLDSELVKLNAAIDALQASVRALTEEQKKHTTHELQIEQLRERLHGLETKREEDLRAQRTYTRETTRELFEEIKSNNRVTADKIEALNTTVNTIFRDIAADLGALKAQVESQQP